MLFLLFLKQQLLKCSKCSIKSSSMQQGPFLHQFLSSIYLHCISQASTEPRSLPQWLQMNYHTPRGNHVTLGGYWTVTESWCYLQKHCGHDSLLVGCFSGAPISHVVSQQRLSPASSLNTHPLPYCHGSGACAFLQVLLATAGPLCLSKPSRKLPPLPGLVNFPYTKP